jgi:hypothetical protein
VEGALLGGCERVEVGSHAPKGGLDRPQAPVLAGKKN